ncbi:MAG: hypothetical protein U0271_38810 [Polyangiaceae bacterium]
MGRIDVNSASDPLVNSVVLERYRVLRLLNEGSLHRSYLAEDLGYEASEKVGGSAERGGRTEPPEKVGAQTKSTGELAILKVAQRSSEEPPPSFSRALLVARHPPRSTMPTLFQLDNGAAAIMRRFVRGMSLGDRLERRTIMPYGELATCVEELARGLGHLHARGIAHGAVSPNNVIVTTEGGAFTCSLVDPWPFAPSERPASAYTAPELREGKLGPAADVYALAALVYYGLTGAELMSARATPTLRQARPSIPVILSDLVLAALSSDPEARPSVAAFASAVIPCLRSLEETSRMPTRRDLRVTLPPSQRPNGRAVAVGFAMDELALLDKHAAVLGWELIELSLDRVPPSYEINALLFAADLSPREVRPVLQKLKFGQPSATVVAVITKRGYHSPPTDLSDLTLALPRHAETLFQYLRTLHNPEKQDPCGCT